MPKLLFISCKKIYIYIFFLLMQNKTQTSQSSYSPPQRGIMPQTAFYPVYTSSPFGSNYSTALVFVLLSAPPGSTRKHLCWKQTWQSATSSPPQLSSRSQKPQRPNRRSQSSFSRHHPLFSHCVLPSLVNIIKADWHERRLTAWHMGIQKVCIKLLRKTSHLTLQGPL